jgi:tryptophan halogenase
MVDIMQPKKIKKVVIVGGGTAGWMAAASFSKLMGKNFELTLIESDEISTIGVGEGTIPPIVFLNRLLEVNEQEFLAEVRGTFKLGISFENWRDVNKNYFHSFGALGQDCWAAGFQHFWLKGLQIGVDSVLDDYCLEANAASTNKFAHLPGGAVINYAYHVDAGLCAKFLRKIAEQHGILRVEGKIVHVETNHQTGFIESVKLMSGQVIEGDLFIDCSGFRGLLIEETLHTGYEDWSHWLPCDSAIAVQTKSVRDPVPYTRSIAHSEGWQWQIPLQHRVGNGLVYCSRYLSDEDAKKTLLDNVDGDLISEPKLIKFRPGQRLKYWNKNCIALGLASGFIEPLESTSIHLIQRGIMRLMQLFPLDGITQVEEDEYNQQMKSEVHNIRDLIILHYHLTEREDSRFWRYCKNMSVPQSLKQRMEYFKETGKVFVKAEDLFREASWLQIMIGQGLMPDSYHAIVNQMSDDELKSFLSTISTKIKGTVSQLPSQQEYINYYCKAAPWEKAM